MSKTRRKEPRRRLAGSGKRRASLVGATGYTSQPLYAPASRTGTLLLEPDGDGFTVLGEAWAKLRYEDHSADGLPPARRPRLRQPVRRTDGETQYTHALGRDVSLSVGAQYTDQRSVGQELFGRFQTWSVGARVTLDAYGASISPSFHRTGSGNSIQTPHGRWPGYLKLITKDFDLARQTALGVRLEYDAGRVGAPGLVGRFFFASGIDAVNPTSGKPEREYDFDVAYEPPRGWIKGFSFRVRVGLVQQSGTVGLLPDIRLIMNYELPLLKGRLAREVRAWWQKD